jgi:hypothetical protein
MVVPMHTMELQDTMVLYSTHGYYGSTHGYYGTIGYYRILITVLQTGTM